MAKNPAPLVQSLKKLAVAIFGVNQKIGTTDLKTQDKTLTGAINELYDRPTATGGLDESTVNGFIDTRINQLTNGASSAFDTLKEIEDAINSGSTATQALLEDLGKTKAKLTALEQDMADIKAYIGFDERAQLENLIENALTQGA